MRFAFALSVPIALAVAYPALADDWQRTYDVSGTAALTLRADDAAVVVEGWDRAQVSVRVETGAGTRIGPRGIEVEDRQNGDAVTIRVTDRRRWWPLRIDWSVTRVEVRVPRHARLDLYTGDGRCEAAGVDGDIRIESGDGAIVTESTGGRMSLQTGDGRIIVRRGQGLLSARTHDGRIEVGGTFAGLDLQSGDGSILAELEPGSLVRQDWSLETQDGRIRLFLPEDLDAELDARTGDGSIRVRLPASGSVERRHARVRLGAGGAVIRLRSGDGSIAVARNERYAPTPGS